MSLVSATPEQRVITPLAVCVINGKRFAVTKARATQKTFGVASELSATIPLMGSDGVALVDDATLDACFNNDNQDYALYFGNVVEGNPPVLDNVGTGTVDTCGFVYNTTDGECLEISGPDYLGLFSQTTITPQAYQNSKSSDIALAWALQHTLTPHVTPTATTIGHYYPSGDSSYLTATSMSQLDMLAFLAKLENFIFWVSGHDFYFGPPQYGTTFDLFYRIPGISDTALDLRVDRHPKGNKNIQVVAQTYDRHNKSAIVHVQSKGQTEPLHAGDPLQFDVPVGTNPLSPGGDINLNITTPTNVTSTQGATDSVVTVTVQLPQGTDSRTARAQAKRVLQDLLLAERTLQATLPGTTAIQRNSPVVVHQGYVKKPATGKFFVTELTHDFSPEGGYTTAITATNFPYGYQIVNGQ